MCRLFLGTSACLLAVACNGGGDDHTSTVGLGVVTATQPGPGTSALPSTSVSEPAPTGGGASGSEATADAATIDMMDTADLTGVTGMNGMNGTNGTNDTTEGGPSGCGDGVLDPGEECDDGAQNGPHHDCYADCTLNHCGDGVSELPEECDLGSANGPDGGCSQLCEVLPSACGTQSAAAQVTIKPVDIVIVIDNSGSMALEIAGVESNINKNFADILAASGLDYRVILVSAFGKNSIYKVCIEAPLGGIPPGGCLEPPAQPVNNPGRFYHYSTPISSVDAACRALSTFDGAEPDLYGFAPLGWRSWLRADSLKVFLVITDDQMACSYGDKNYIDSNMGPDAVLAATAFDAAILARSPLHFGTAEARNYRWYSIVGMGFNVPPSTPYTPKDPLIAAKCPSAVTGGLGYQALSNVTGGWRFPLCDTSQYDQVFDGIAQNVVEGAKIACDFVIPAAPEGKALDEDSVVVHVTPMGEMNPEIYEQVPGLEMCAPMAFYVADGKVILCPEACAALQNDKAAEIEVEFTCEPLIPN